MSKSVNSFNPLKIVSLCLVSGFSILALMPTASASKVEDLKFIGQVTYPTGTEFQGTEVGGLSGITYDPVNQLYYIISDDRSEKAPARFYTFKINLTQDSLQNIEINDVTTLLNQTGQPFAPLSLDPEGIALSRNGNLFISSEGDANRLVNPFINQFSLLGQQLQVLPITDKFLPTATQNRGIRNNLAFESLTITPNQKYLFTATENALYQDGAAATINNGSLSRILKYNLTTRNLEQEFLYLTEPVATTPNPGGSFSTNGLVELLALNEKCLLSLERSFSTGIGNSIKLYEVSLNKADDIKNIDSLSNINLNQINPGQKKLLLDFNNLNLTLDNIEGMTLGSDLGSDRRSLIFVSDNNFSTVQETQILAFSIKINPNGLCARD